MVLSLLFFCIPDNRITSNLIFYMVLSFLFQILDEPPCCIRQCTMKCIFVLYFFICVVSRGFVAHYFFICTELTQLYSFFGSPGLHTLRRNKRGMCMERTITWTYYKSYKFIYWNKYVHECYLADPGVRCPSHTSPSSICLLAAFKYGATNHLCLLWNQEEADCLWLSTYIIR